MSKDLGISIKKDDALLYLCQVAWKGLFEE